MAMLWLSLPRRGADRDSVPTLMALVAASFARLSRLMS
jgi:hypothetical protein